MTVKNVAKAGTLESSDILIQIFPNSEEKGIEIELRSPVEFQFGNSIKNSIEEVCRDMGITHARIVADDRGAIDVVIRARLETAIKRGLK